MSWVFYLLWFSNLISLALLLFFVMETGGWYLGCLFTHQMSGLFWSRARSGLCLDLFLLILIWDSGSQGKHSYAPSHHPGKESIDHVALLWWLLGPNKERALRQLIRFVQINQASKMKFLCPLWHPKNISSRDTLLALFASCLDYRLVFCVVPLCVHGLERQSSLPESVGEITWDTKVVTSWPHLNLFNGSPQSTALFLKSGPVSLSSTIHSFNTFFLSTFLMPGIVTLPGTLNISFKQNAEEPWPSWDLPSCGLRRQQIGKQEIWYVRWCWVLRKTIKQGQRTGHARLGAVCEGFTEKVTFGKRSVIGDRSSQEGNIWRENIPDRRKIKGKGPEVGTCLMSLSYNKVTSVTGVKWSRERITRGEWWV